MLLHALQVSGQEKIAGYIGHSQGGTSGFAVRNLSNNLY